MESFHFTWIARTVAQEPPDGARDARATARMTSQRQVTLRGAEDIAALAGRPLAVFNQLQQYTARGCRMYKNVAMATGPGLRLVEEACPGRTQASHRGLKIRDPQCDVMQTIAAPGKKAADDGIGLGRLEELNARATRRQHRHTHLFVRHGFARSDLHPELY